MDVLAIVGLGAIGFLIGSLVFARVGRWIVTIHEIAKDEGAASKGITLASAALLSDGPWFLIAAAVFAAYAQSEPWATPIFVGAVLAMVFFGALTAYLARKASRL